jgi:hypothetical protein
VSFIDYDVRVTTLVWAAIQTQPRPVKTRNRATTMLFELLEPQAALGFAAVIDARDSPPGWFGGIPEDDLQPQLIACVEQAFRAAFAAGLTAPPAACASAMLARAHAELATLAANDPFVGSCAQAIVAVVAPERIGVAWVGTARAYRVGAGGAALLTRDHTLREDWDGTPRTTAEIAGLPTGIITRALAGRGEPPAPGSVELALGPGERLALVGPCIPLEDAGVDPATLLEHAPPHVLAATFADRAVRAAPGYPIAIAAIELAGTGRVTTL